MNSIMYEPNKCPVCGSRTSTTVSDYFNADMEYCTNNGSPIFNIPPCNWEKVEGLPKAWTIEISLPA